MKKHAILLAILFMSLVSWGQSDFGLDEPDTSKTKVGHQFYIKAELLNSVVKMFIPNTYHFDVQLTTRITNKIHWVNTYGQTTFFTLDSAESLTLPGVYQSFEIQGLAKHRSSSMIRYYPFYNYGSGIDYLFVEAGAHFQRYTGSSISKIYDNNTNTLEEHTIQNLEMLRSGPQLNIGMSYFFDESNIYNPRGKKKIIFSPEFMLGVNYTNTKILSNDVNHLVGNSDNFEDFSDKKFHFLIRVKLGFGIL